MVGLLQSDYRESQPSRVPRSACLEYGSMGLSLDFAVVPGSGCSTTMLISSQGPRGHLGTNLLFLPSWEFSPGVCVTQGHMFQERKGEERAEAWLCSSLRSLWLSLLPKGHDNLCSCGWNPVTLGHPEAPGSWHGCMAWPTSWGAFSTSFFPL